MSATPTSPCSTCGCRGSTGSRWWRDSVIASRRFLTAYTHASLVHSAMAAGATAYVAKDNDREEILTVLVDAAAGRRRVLVAEHARDELAPRPSLSSRERIVLSMLNDGWSLEELAMVADMAPTAVNAHLVNARRKLGAVTTADAIAAAEAWGLLS